jgi:hypothetical protein
MAFAEVLLVVVVFALVVYALLSRVIEAAGSPVSRDDASSAARWRSTHYEKHGQTRVVLQKISGDGKQVLDEHTVATIPSEDPSYEDKFLAAMLAARQRQALFESEDG